MSVTNNHGYHQTDSVVLFDEESRAFGCVECEEELNTAGTYRKLIKAYQNGLITLAELQRLANGMEGKTYED